MKVEYQGYDGSIGRMLDKFDTWIEHQKIWVKTTSRMSEKEFASYVNGLNDSKEVLIVIAGSVQRFKDECKAGAGC